MRTFRCVEGAVGCPRVAEVGEALCLPGQQSGLSGAGYVPGVLESVAHVVERDAVVAVEAGDQALRAAHPHDQLGVAGVLRAPQCCPRVL